ncbi:MAG: class I SAM-dependent methyltransferase [bacterium]
MVDCIHYKDNIYNIWEAPKKTKLYKNELLRYHQIISYLPKNIRKVLDLGCGTGYMSYLLAKNKYEVTSVDKSSERLSYFKENINDKNIRILNSDMFEYNEKDFDLVVCQEVIEHIPDYKRVIEKIYSLLKIDGFAIITTPYKENLSVKTKKCDVCGKYYHTSGHLHSFDKNILNNACIKENFNIIKTLLIVNNRTIRFFAYFNVPVNKYTIIIDKLFNKLFPHKAAYLLVLIRKNSI